MELSLGEMSDERFDEHGRFSLSNERTGCCYYSLGTRNPHRPEEEDGKFADEPLKYAVVETELNKGNEEDDRWQY